MRDEAKPAGILSLIWPWSAIAKAEHDRDAYAFSSRENRRIADETARRLRDKTNLCDIQRGTIIRQEKYLERAIFRNALGRMGPKGQIPLNVRDEVDAEIRKERDSSLVKKA